MNNQLCSQNERNYNTIHKRSVIILQTALHITQAGGMQWTAILIGHLKKPNKQNHRKTNKKPPPKAKQTKNAKTHTSWTHHFHAYILHQGYTKVPWLQAGKSSSSTKVVSPPQHYNILMGRHLPLESTFSASSHFKCSILPSFPTYNLQFVILVWGIDALGKLFSFL